MAPGLVMGTLEPGAAGSEGAAGLPAQQRPSRQVRRMAVEGRAAPALPDPGGFWEPEKLAREKGVAPWSYYSLTDGRPFFMAGLWAEASDPATGEVADTYTLIITDANATMRVHDRMPVVLATDAARRWIEPGPLPGELLVPYPAEEMTAWRVADDAKNSRIEPHPGMAEPAVA